MSDGLTTGSANADETKILELDNQENESIGVTN